MFFCNECAYKNEWQRGFIKSYGKCEVCGESKSCSDVPSKYLSAVNEPYPEDLSVNWPSNGIKADDRGVS